MESSSGVLAPPDEFAGLAPSARAPSARTRLGIGAAIVLFLIALVVAVIISALSSGGANDRVPLGEPGDSVAGGSSGADSDAAGGSGAASGTPQANSTSSDAAAGGAHVFVHVLGAVTTAGLYELSEGSRVVDVVAAAGGFTAEADPGGVNLARLLTDGEQLYVPRIGEVPPPIPAGVGGPDAAGGAGVAGAGGGAGLVNLNSATSGDLETLPRIGPSLAQRILDWREANGGFASVDDLRNVTGIGDKTFEGLKDFVTV